MGASNLHAEHDNALPSWQVMRDVLAGEATIKRRGESYLPKLQSQNESDYEAYKARANFFNATGRTHETLTGLVFRTGGVLETGGLSEREKALFAELMGDVDLKGGGLETFARELVSEVLATGRVGVLVDWEGGAGGRPVGAMYRAEDILNWREQRVGGRRQLTLVVLREWIEDGNAADEFDTGAVEQLRVLRLVGLGGEAASVEVEVLRRDGEEGKKEWVVIEEAVPKRGGKALNEIPFLFCGVEGTGARVGAIPLVRLAWVNLDHYRLDADYKHGLHYAALPTAWVSGIDAKSKMSIGSRTAWVLDNKDARCGYLEFTGQGMQALAAALDRDERQMAVLGMRMLESQKRAYESAQAIEVRQTAEHCSLAWVSAMASATVTGMLRWFCWWQNFGGTDATHEGVSYELTRDFTPMVITGDAVNALVGAWEKGAISQDTLLDTLRRGEILQEVRTNEEEAKLARNGERGARNGEMGTSNIQHSTSNVEQPMKK